MQLNDSYLSEELFDLLTSSDGPSAFIEALEDALHRTSALLISEESEQYRNIALELQDLRRRDFAYSDEAPEIT